MTANGESGGKSSGKSFVKKDTRFGGMRSLSGVIQPVARKALGKKGRAFAAFLADWPSVVGEQTARHCLPQGLRFPDRERHRDGVLTLKVANQAWATELQHLAPLLLEKINVYFGYTAVAELRFVSGPLPERPSPGGGAAPAQRPLSAAQEAALEERLLAIPDPELREAMRQLGRRLLARGEG